MTAVYFRHLSLFYYHRSILILNPCMHALFNDLTYTSTLGVGIPLFLPIFRSSYFLPFPIFLTLTVH